MGRAQGYLVFYWEVLQAKLITIDLSIQVNIIELKLHWLNMASRKVRNRRGRVPHPVQTRVVGIWGHLIDNARPFGAGVEDDFGENFLTSKVQAADIKGVFFEI